MSIKKLTRKILVFVSLLLAVVALFSCAELSESPAINAKREAKKDVQTVLGKLVWDASDSTGITSDIELATSNQNFPNVTIEWESSEPDVISNTGKVSRPGYADPRAYVPDGSEESYVEIENEQEVTKWRDKVVKVVLTATAHGTYSYKDADGKYVEKEVPAVSKNFEFTVLTLSHDIVTGTIAEVKAAAWDYVYNVKGVQKALVSANDVQINGLVRGVVTAKLEAKGSTSGFMIHDGTEGIYVYGDNTKVKVGDYVTVIGGIYTYYGSLQFGSNVSTSISDTPFDFEVTENDYIATTPLELENLHKNYVEGVIGYFGGKLLKISGIITARTAPAGSGKYCILDANDGQETTWIYYKSYNAEMENQLKELAGKYVEAYVVSYDRDSRLNKNEIMWTGAYKEVEAPELSDTVKVAQALGSITLPEEAAADFTLPTAKEGTTTWAVKSGTGIEVNGTNAKVTKAATQQTVVLTVTVQINDAKDSKDITVKVPATVSYTYNVVENPVANKEYVLGVNQANLKKDLFFNGQASGNFLAATDDFGSAVKVTLEAVDGGYNVSFKLGDAKKYINLVISGTYVNLVIEDSASTVWTVNSEINGLVVNLTVGSNAPEDYYLGTYNQYNNLRMSKISFAATSFVCHFYEGEGGGSVTPTDKPAVVTSPAVDKEYVLMLNQETLKKELFFDGAQNGNFLGVTEESGKAATVKLEAATGGYYLVLVTETGKKYINTVVSGKYCNTVLEDAPSAVWVFNTDYNTLTAKATVNSTEGDYYMGSYKDYERISMSAISFAASSYPLHLYLRSDYPASSVEPTPVDPTDKPAVVTSPAVDKEYVLMLNQETLKKELFFDGAQNGNFLGVTEESGKAATVKLEAATGGYYLVLVTETGKKYINTVVSGKYCNTVLEDAPSAVWVFNTDYNTLTAKATVNSTEGDYYMGSYKDYERISMSAISFAASSYPLHLYLRSDYPASSVEPTPVDPTPVDPTPVDPQPTTNAVATFSFVDKGTEANKESSTRLTSLSKTDGAYTITLADFNNVFNGWDGSMDGVLKLGTSSKVGGFSFTVADDITSVKIYVAGWKTTPGKFTINGTEYTTTTLSSNSEYEAITIDTSTVKKVELTTVKGGVRMMVKTVEYYK